MKTSLSKQELEKTLKEIPLEVAKLKQDARLAGVEVAKADLDGDGKISGTKEIGELFKALDKFDDDKDPNSVRLADNKGEPTAMHPRVQAILDLAQTSPMRPSAPGKQPSPDPKVAAGQAYAVMTKNAFDRATRGNDFVARQAIHDSYVALKLSPGRDGVRSIVGGAENLRRSGNVEKSFDMVASDIEAQVKKGKLSKEQGQAVLFDLFEGYAKVAAKPDEILARYKKSALSEPFKNRDTDGDGKRDVVEMTKGSDIFENTRIKTLGGRDLIESRRNALEDAIHNPVRANAKKGEGTHQTYVGDQGLSWGAKNGGWATFTPKKVHSDANGRDYMLPTNLELGGEKTSVKLTSTEVWGSGSRTQTAIVVSRGDANLVAIPGAQNSLRFYQRADSMTADGITVNGKVYKPMDDSASKKLQDLATGFEHAYVTANTNRARVSVDEHNQRALDFAQSRKGETDSIVAKLDAGTKSSIDGAVTATENANAKLRQYSEEFIEHLNAIAPAVQAGWVKLDINQTNGKVKLSLVRGPLKSDDFAKLEKRFGEKLKYFETAISEKSEKLHQAVLTREVGAKNLLAWMNSPDLLTYLEKLPPEARTAEMARLSHTLLGTEAGKTLAKEFQDALRDPSRASPFAEMVLNEPVPRSDTTKNNLSVIGQTIASASGGYSDEYRHGLYFQIVTGRAPNEDEKKVINELVQAQETAAKMPEALRSSNLQVLMERVFLKYPGQASHVLHAYGHSVHHAIEHAAKHGDSTAKAVAAAHGPSHAAPAAWKHKASMIGAAGFSLVSFGLSLQHAFEHPTPGTIVHAGVEGINLSVMLAGTAEAFVAKGTGTAKFLGKVGKYGGPIVAAAHLVTDVVAYGSKNSSEGKSKAMNQIAGSGLLLAGALLASNPIGWGLAAVGLAIKIFGGDTDPRYEAAYGKLDDIPWAYELDKK